jgi:hypothetical protein|nr:MAG TPA: hypothetical protein [Caudoviricetes sp.]
MKKQLKQIRGVPPILVFNPLKRLVGIFASKSAAAKILDTTPVNIMYACNGTSISCRQLYFRELASNIEVTFDDFHTLRLEEYDQMCGVTRKYYLTKNMSPSGKKTEITNKK